MSDDLLVYRVRQLSWHPRRHLRRAWYGRTWQAEWSECPWSPRAYTEGGVRRKAARWRARGWDWQIRNARRRTWVRMYITRRSDPYYAAKRVAA